MKWILHYTTQNGPKLPVVINRRTEKDVKFLLPEAVTKLTKIFWLFCIACKMYVWNITTSDLMSWIQSLTINLIKNAMHIFSRSIVASQLKRFCHLQLDPLPSINQLLPLSLVLFSLPTSSDTIWHSSYLEPEALLIEFFSPKTVVTDFTGNKLFSQIKCYVCTFGE